MFYVYRKLRATLDEYTTRVGQQAIVLCVSPSKPNPVFKVFGAAPLENVVSGSIQSNPILDKLTAVSKYFILFCMLHFAGMLYELMFIIFLGNKWF